ncbi:MAG TPA: hypothetical protein VL020_04100 [Pseudomonadales bacterium]|nr:hypothetical protein [Pseudomonadales bacterium]
MNDLVEALNRIAEAIEANTETMEQFIIALAQDDEPDIHAQYLSGKPLK